MHWMKTAPEFWDYNHYYLEFEEALKDTNMINNF